MRYQGLSDTGQTSAQRRAGKSEQGGLTKDHSVNVTFGRADRHAQANLPLTLTDRIGDQRVQATPHPGETIKEDYLLPLGMSVNQLSPRLSASERPG